MIQNRNNIYTKFHNFGISISWASQSDLWSYTIFFQNQPNLFSNSRFNFGSSQRLGNVSDVTKILLIQKSTSSTSKYILFFSTISFLTSQRSYINFTCIFPVNWMSRFLNFFQKFESIRYYFRQSAIKPFIRVPFHSLNFNRCYCLSTTLSFGQR